MVTIHICIFLCAIALEPGAPQPGGKRGPAGLLVIQSRPHACKTRTGGLGSSWLVLVLIFEYICAKAK